MGELVRVRQGRQDDFEFIVKAQMDMAWETENLRLDEPTVQKGCRAVLEDSAKGQYWIVESEGVRLGMCLTLPEWSDWRNGTVLWIHSVYTIPSARGKGVYRALYSHLKTMVQNTESLRGLRLYADKRNQNAQQIYKKLGMNSEHYDLFEWMKTF